MIETMFVALQAFMLSAKRCKSKWVRDPIHSTNEDYLMYLPAAKGSSSGVYAHYRVLGGNGWFELGHYDHAYDNIGSAVFRPNVGLPIVLPDDTQ